jgi:hypothetical protein
MHQTNFAYNGRTTGRLVGKTEGDKKIKKTKGDKKMDIAKR